MEPEAAGPGVLFPPWPWPDVEGRWVGAGPGPGGGRAERLRVLGERPEAEGPEGPEGPDGPEGPEGPEGEGFAILAGRLPACVEANRQGQSVEAGEDEGRGRT